jgi:hypothetical protein
MKMPEERGEQDGSDGSLLNILVIGSIAIMTIILLSSAVMFWLVS